MFEGVIFANVENKKNLDNLYCIASVFYYIIRSYNSQILETNKLIEIDFEIGEVGEKLLTDDPPIYERLDTLVQDGITQIDEFMEVFMQRINNTETDDTVSVG